MRKYRLLLTDARLRAVLGALKTCGPGLGDLAEDPGSAPAFFAPLRARLRRAAGNGAPASSRALAAAEEFTERLEKLFSGLALHGTAPDAAVMEALLCLQRACGEARDLLSTGSRAAAFARLRGFSAGGRKCLALARTAAAASPGGFPQNLKFSSIYSGLDAAFDAYERCAEALFKI
ncbi:MAG: hypothetical protein HY550_09790 [Elusimicrobia bacterium]|nr:hypothetical protein [Elusimicrobiota bacterium]